MGTSLSAVFDECSLVTKCEIPPQYGRRSNPGTKANRWRWKNSWAQDRWAPISKPLSSTKKTRLPRRPELVGEEHNAVSSLALATHQVIKRRTCATAVCLSMLAIAGAKSILGNSSIMLRSVALVSIATDEVKYILIFTGRGV